MSLLEDYMAELQTKGSFVENYVNCRQTYKIALESCWLFFLVCDIEQLNFIKKKKEKLNRKQRKPQKKFNGFCVQIIFVTTKIYRMYTIQKYLETYNSILPCKYHFALLALHRESTICWIF